MIASGLLQVAESGCQGSLRGQKAGIQLQLRLKGLAGSHVKLLPLSLHGLLQQDHLLDEVLEGEGIAVGQRRRSVSSGRMPA